MVATSPLPQCAHGPHQAELVPGTDETYIAAQHSGAWKATCAVHSGICHDVCWSDFIYPDLRPRVATKES